MDVKVLVFPGKILFAVEKIQWIEVSIAMFLKMEVVFVTAFPFFKKRKMVTKHSNFPCILKINKNCDLNGFKRLFVKNMVLYEAITLQIVNDWKWSSRLTLFQFALLLPKLGDLGHEDIISAC